MDSYDEYFDKLVMLQSDNGWLMDECIGWTPAFLLDNRDVERSYSRILLFQPKKKACHNRSFDLVVERHIPFEIRFPTKEEKEDVLLKLEQKTYLFDDGYLDKWILTRMVH